MRMLTIFYTSVGGELEIKFTHSLAFLFPDVRTCHGIPVNISLVFLPGPTLATELQGPSSAGVPGDLSVSRAGRAGGEGFPASLDHIPIYTLLPVPTPSVWPTTPHARIPTGPPAYILHDASLLRGRAEAAASAWVTSPLLPVSKAPSGKPLDISQLFNCSLNAPIISGTCCPELRLPEGRC